MGILKGDFERGFCMGIMKGDFERGF